MLTPPVLVLRTEDDAPTLDVKPIALFTFIEIIELVRSPSLILAGLDLEEEVRPG